MTKFAPFTGTLRDLADMIDAAKVKARVEACFADALDAVNVKARVEALFAASKV